MESSFLQNFYCKLSIDGHQLIPKNISSCTIREWIFDILPRIELTIHDDGQLTEMFPILDNSVLDIEFGVNPNDPNIINTSFDIIDKNIAILDNNKSTLISLTGILKTKNCFFPIKNRSFRNQNSISVLSSISNEIGLKFNKDLDLKTSDLMTWLQININNFDFIKHILKRSYSNDDLLLCYADLNNKLNYTSIKSSINNEKYVAKYNIENFNKYVFEDKIDEKTIWYNNFSTVNYTKSFNLKYGYGMIGSYFDSNINKSIQVDKNYFPFTENSYKSEENVFVNKKIFPTYTNNIYEDYFKAKLQNIYFKNLFNISTIVHINPLSKVKLMDLVDFRVNSISLNQLDNVQSGEYLVGGIIHNFGNSTNYRKRISIHRNGYNKPQIF